MCDCTWSTIARCGLAWCLLRQAAEMVQVQVLTRVCNCAGDQGRWVPGLSREAAPKCCKETAVHECQ